MNQAPRLAALAAALLGLGALPLSGSAATPAKGKHATTQAVQAPPPVQPVQAGQPAAAAAGAPRAGSDETVSLNFANADIEGVIAAIGRITGRNFLIDPRVKGKLNIVTNTPVPRDLAYQILLSALRLQGYAAVDSAGVTKIVPEADAKLHAVPLKQGRQAGASGDRLVTQVFPLRHESANQMVTVVRPLVSPNNTVTAFPANNTLVVTDYAENMERIAQIIASVDVPQGDVVVLELQHAAAADLAGTVTKLMSEGSGGTTGAAAGDPSQKVQIIADPRTNSLLVRADNPSKISAVRQVVAALDRPGASGNIHVVYLKNAQATQVAETLNAAISGESRSGNGSNPYGTSPLSSGTGQNGSNGNGAAGSSTGMGSNAGGSFSNGNGLNSSTSRRDGSMVQADPLNNALIITAPEAIYRNLRAVVDLLDRRRAQVYVEALIAEISAERAAEIGIQWQSANVPTDSGKTTVFGGTNFGSKTGGTNIIGVAANPASVAGGLNFMVGSGTVNIPGIGEVLNLSVLARFLESEAKANILSTPNLVTLDNEEAKIVIGRNLPFVTGQYSNTSGAATPTNPFQTIERKDVGLTLRVRPQISEGGTVKMQIYQEASSVSNATVQGLDSNSGPITNKRSIESTVLVDDGAVIALGGLVEDSYTGDVEKVPLLGDIPMAGQLFRYDNRKRTKTNLVVFLRPRILRDEKDYAGITQSRYEYVIGEQRATAGKDELLRGERTPPELPPLGSPQPAVPMTRVPVEELTIKPIAQ